MGDSVERFDSDDEERIIQLMPEKPASAFRLSELSKRRLRRMATELEKSESAVLEIAITHLLATLERDEGVQMTASDEPLKTHKRPNSAA